LFKDTGDLRVIGMIARYGDALATAFRYECGRFADCAGQWGPIPAFGRARFNRPTSDIDGVAKLAQSTRYAGTSATASACDESYFSVCHLNPLRFDAHCLLSHQLP
jgi:hypothetical protein